MPLRQLAAQRRRLLIYGFLAVLGFIVGWGVLTEFLSFASWHKRVHWWHRFLVVGVLQSGGVTVFLWGLAFGLLSKRPFGFFVLGWGGGAAVFFTSLIPASARLLEPSAWGHGQFFVAGRAWACLVCFGLS